MSIYVYISRRADPFDDSGPSIEAEQWLSAIEADATFEPPSESETEWLGENARMWRGHDPAMAFDWHEGQIEVKNPDTATIAKMKQVASKLAAKVFSETGEHYKDSGEHAGFLPGFP